MNASEKSDTVEQNQDEECRFNFNGLKLSSLEEIASFQIVLPIWRNYLDRMKPRHASEMNLLITGKHFSADGCLRKCDYSIKFLKLPASMEEYLKKMLINICEETNEWMHYFKYNLISIYLSSFRINNLNPTSCVWLPNGKIDYRRSVPKILTDPGLTQVHRFAIMCEYCLEDEIKRFSLTSLPEDFINTVSFDADYLLYYWIRYLRNEVAKIPLNGYNSVDFLMAATCNNERWTAFEYFWDRIDTNDQVSAAVLRFQSPRAYSTQNRLLCKMSWFHQRCLLAEVPDKIILNFLLRLNSPESALWAWKHSKDVINAEQFVNIIRKMFLEVSRDEEGIRVLIEIWNTAPDDLKRTAAETREYDILRPFLQSCSSDFPSVTYQFLNLFLLAKSTGSRRSFVLENAVDFGTRCIDPCSMNAILHSSLPDHDDQLRYKQKVLNSREMEAVCIELIEEEHFDILNSKVEFHSSDVEANREYKKKLLVKSRGIDRKTFVFNSSKWSELCKFIEQTFPNESSISQIKKEFISTYARTGRSIRLCYDSNSLDVMVNLVEQVFPIDRLATIKETFFNSFKAELVDPQFWLFFDSNCVQMLVPWCLGNDEKALREFKKTLNIDRSFCCIFNELQKDYCSERKLDEELLFKADEWLNWYFNTVEESRKFKINKIHEFDEDYRKPFNILQLIRKNSDTVCLVKLLCWFFEGQPEAAKKILKNEKYQFVNKEINLIAYRGRVPFF